MSLFLEGLAFGVLPVFFVGPVLFTLLAASLEEGFAAGARVAVGIALSDVVAIALCAAGAGPLLTQPWGEWLLRVAGGLILAGFGVALLARAGRPMSMEGGRRGGGRHLLAGFVVNFVNPFVFAFWIGALSGVGARHGLDPSTLALFFGGTVTTILITDLGKAWGAAALHRHLHGRALTWARRVSGALLGGAGLVLLAQAVTSGLP